MGMSASQARYLQLTARRSDIEYEAQQITQARMALAESSSKIANDYNNALGNRRLFFQSNAASGSTAMPLLTYYNIVGAFEEGGMGMQLIDARGKIVVPELPAVLEEGKTSADYVIDYDLKDSEYLDKCIRNYVYFLGEKVTTDEGESKWQQINYTDCLYIADSNYSEDDARATAKYEEESQKIQKQDKLLELRLSALDAQRKSIDTELDSIKEVIKNNTKVFSKTFNG